MHPVPSVFDYLVSIMPAGMLALALLWLVPRALTGARVAVHILFFIVARDAMSPAGFWQIGAGAMRLTAPAPVLLALAGMSATLVAGVSWLERPAREGMVWWTEGRAVRSVLRSVLQSVLQSVLWGVLGAAAITAIAAAMKAAAGLPSLPPTDASKAVPILVFALLGNAYEELLFRGMLQQRLARHMSPMRAVAASAVLFSLCHAWLALVVTRVGLPVFVFTLIEGLVAGLVYRRVGLLGAALAHGLAIYALATGWY